MSYANYNYHYVYKITNNKNRKYYIGMHSTNDLNDGYMGSSTLVAKAIKKHGLPEFTKEILAFTKTREEAFKLEATLVTQKEVKDSQCYNLKVGGFRPPSQKGKKHSKETRAKMSASHKGFKHTLESRAKMRASSLDKKHTKEARAKIRKSKLGRAGGTLGMKLPMSQETKVKISAALKGKKKTPEHCANMSRSQKGKPKPRSQEHQRKINLSRIKPMTKEARDIIVAMSDWRDVTPMCLRCRMIKNHNILVGLTSIKELQSGS